MSEFVFFDGLNIRVCVFVMFGSIASLFQSIGVQTWNRAGLRWSAATAELPMQSLWDNTVPDKKSSIQEKVSVSVLKWSRTETRKVHFRINLDLRAINHSFSYSCSWWQLWFEKTLNSISSWKYIRLPQRQRNLYKSNKEPHWRLGTPPDLDWLCVTTTRTVRNLGKNERVQSSSLF